MSNWYEIAMHAFNHPRYAGLVDKSLAPARTAARCKTCEPAL